MPGRYTFFARHPHMAVRIVAGFIGILIVTGAGFVYMQSHARRFASKASVSSRKLEQPQAPIIDSALAAQFAAIRTTAVPEPSAPKALPRKRPGPAEEKDVSTRQTAKSDTDTPEKPTVTGDPLEVFIKETEAGNYASALRMFDKLPQSAAAEKTARILRLRALYALGKTAEASRSMGGLVMDDGELFMIKARMLIDKGETDQALQCLEKSVQVEARMVEPAALRRDYLYYRAVCMTRQYEESPTEERRKNALDGWFEVKNSLRKYPDHAYFRKAVSEMQRIGSGAPPSKG